MASTQSLIRSPNETLIAGRLNLNYGLAIQVSRRTLSLLPLRAGRDICFFFSRQRLRRVHVSASDARRNVVQSTRATPADMRPPRFDLCTEILSGVGGKIEGVSQTERMSRDCGRIIGDERSARIPLKSYHRLQSAPASSPRLIFQAGPVNLLEAYDSGEILYDIPPPGYFTVSPCYLLSKQRSLRLR